MNNKPLADAIKYSEAQSPKIVVQTYYQTRVVYDYAAMYELWRAMAALNAASPINALHHTED